MNIAELTKNLASAEEHLNRLQGLPRHDLQVLSSAYKAVTNAQRALAAAKGEEYAIPHDIGFEPEAAVSEALLLKTENESFLTFRAVRTLPNGTREDAGYAIIENLDTTKFGYPNDEALPGHPLYKRGLGCYGIFEVINSSWVKQMTEQNRVSFPNTPDSKKRHFIFTFHDSTLECTSLGLRASLSRQPYATIFAEITKKAIILFQ